MKHFSNFCGPEHFSRRTLLKTAGAAGLAWLTPLSQLLAAEAEKAPKGQPARSVIILWLAGGPSQLETFDPHSGSKIAGDTKSIKTAVQGIELAEGFDQLAEVMEDVSLIRSVVSKEGDHERAIYNMKTGYRPTPTLVHPSIGSIICHELPSPTVEIPTHVSILPTQWPARGGYLGAEFDAFMINDPAERIPDITNRVSDERFSRRMENLSIVDQAFAKGRRTNLDQHTMQQALRIMHSDQLKAFDVNEATVAERAVYGHTAFGRGCLAAMRLIETGVRCVEVNLNGWDTHVNNREQQQGLVQVLDPAFSALIRDLKQRGLLEHTVVLCGGEFGRTPTLNPFEGRDHWPHGFSVAMAGGGIRGGHVIGATDPAGEKEEPDQPIRVEDIHTTIQHALGIDYEKEIETPVGRPIALSEGRVIRELLG